MLKLSINDDLTLLVTWANLSIIVQKADFNKHTTIHDSLRKSERTKNLINTKASEGNKHTQDDCCASFPVMSFMAIMENITNI